MSGVKQRVKRKVIEEGGVTQWEFFGGGGGRKEKEDDKD